MLTITEVKKEAKPDIDYFSSPPYGGFILQKTIVKPIDKALSRGWHEHIEPGISVMDEIYILFNAFYDTVLENVELEVLLTFLDNLETEIENLQLEVTIQDKRTTVYYGNRGRLAPRNPGRHGTEFGDEEPVDEKQDNDGTPSDYNDSNDDNIFDGPEEFEFEEE